MNGVRWAWRAGAVGLVLAAAVGLFAGPWNFLLGSVVGSPAATRSES